MRFAELSKYLDKLEKNSSRLKLTEILSDLFKFAGEDEIDKIVYIILGRLAPKYKTIVFNVAEKMMIQAIAKAYEVDSKEVLAKYKELGDLGDTAFELSSKISNSQFPISNFSVSQVYASLEKIALDEGEGSVERKIDGIAQLLKSLDPLSCRFVARIPIGKLRLGFSDKTIIDALSWMETGDKSKSKRLEQTYFVLPDAGRLASAVKKSGIDKASANIKPELGVPILPMLAQRLKSPVEMIEKMGEVAVEAKYDGLRIQLHFKVGPKGFIKAFTRNLNETSWMFPELNSFKNHIKAKEVILDVEAVGVDETLKKMANFQTTMTRRRKHEIAEVSKGVAIKFYIFDCMYKDGVSLIGDTYRKRRKILKSLVKKSKLLEIVDYQITNDPKVITSVMNKELGEGMEGIIVKMADSKYVAGRTGWRWVKMKESVSDHTKLADTMDCVVMGYTRGKGRRASFGVGQFLVGVRDGEKIKTVTKVGTGLTDDQFKELNTRLKKLVVKNKPKEYLVGKNLEPDFWVEPSLVVELAADEITVSPNHSAGLALRFPRLINFRDDRDLETATTLKEINKLYKLQKN